MQKEVINLENVQEKWLENDALFEMFFLFVQSANLDSFKTNGA